MYFTNKIPYEFWFKSGQGVVGTTGETGKESNCKQSVSGEIVNTLRGGSMDYSE